MFPSLEPGDTVTVEPLEGRPPEAGEVVVIQSASGRPAIHRVVARQRRRGRWLLVTMGDAMGHTDAVIDESHIVARAVSVERGGTPAPIPAHRPGPWSRLEAWAKLVLHGRAGESHPLRRAARAIARVGRKRK